MAKVPMVQIKPRGYKNILREPNKRKGFVRRWVNDDPARVDQMKEEEGYDIVNNVEGGPIKRREFVLMEIPESLYNQKQAEKTASIYAERTKMRMSARARREVEATSGSADFVGRSRAIGGVELTGGATGRQADLEVE